ncbi:MAG: hypothetical protein KJ804_01275 [Proteobacteria bacterium]|nr:hypothetical protein [Pseudomonadota bacterium]MBU1056941.1 hypothetical protein [Pseudomonadota bacterium]
MTTPEGHSRKNVPPPPLEMVSKNSEKGIKSTLDFLFVSCLEKMRATT